MLHVILILSILLSGAGYTSSGFPEGWLENELAPLTQKLSDVTGIPENKVLEAVFGNDLEFVYRTEDVGGYTCYSSLTCIGGSDFQLGEGIMVHEFGHRFVNNTGLTKTQLIQYSLGYYDENGNYVHVSGMNPQTGNYERTLAGQTKFWNTANLVGEDYADMFMAWVLGEFTNNEAGRLRQEYIEEFVLSALRNDGLLTRGRPPRTLLTY